jgi:Ankyrin repeat
MVLPASPPPLHPFVDALTRDKSEQGFRDVSRFLHQIGSANLPITNHRKCREFRRCNRRHDGWIHTPTQLQIYWAIDQDLYHHWEERWGIPRLRLLLDHGAELNVIHETHGMTPLYVALYEDCRIGIVKFLVENGADPNFGGEICPVLVGCIKYSSVTPPFLVARKVKYLLEKGTNPNQIDERGVSALMLAINCCRHDASVKELLRWGANPMLRTALPLIQRPINPKIPYPTWTPEEASKRDISPIELACAWGSTSGSDYIPQIARPSYGKVRRTDGECFGGVPPDSVSGNNSRPSPVQI